MKLYLLSDNSLLINRWMSILSPMHPKASSLLSPEFDNNSIIMVSDTLLKGMHQEVLEKLFTSRVMVLSMTPDFLQAQKYLSLGAMGYGNAMMHETHLHSVYQALEEGKVWLHPDFISLLISQIRDKNNEEKKSLVLLEGLSKREQEVAQMLGNGATHQEIADELDITVRTVKAHATSIYQKLDVKDRLALSLLLHS